MTELKPCPFCGGEAWMRISDAPQILRIECRECHAATTSFVADSIGEKEAAAAWNTRHVETDALREACRELVAYAGTCPFDAKDTDTANWSERCDRECSTDVDMAACWMRYFTEAKA